MELLYQEVYAAITSALSMTNATSEHLTLATENALRAFHNYQANEDLGDDDDDEFDRCSDCDGHDACADFGCAFEAGLGHLVSRQL